MAMDFEKLASAFKEGSRFMDESESLLLAAGVETVILEKKAGRLEGDLDEEGVVVMGAIVADALLNRSV